MQKNRRQQAQKTLRQAAVSSLFLLGLAGIEIVRAELPDLKFPEWAKGWDRPVALLQTQDDRWFVVEQKGVIRVLRTADAAPGAVFLDISDRVNFGGEKGLLGLALHPDFKKNRRFFVNYTTGKDGKDLRTHISEFTASADFSAGDRASEKVLLKYDQPFPNHNGGQVAFGPDGYLYIGAGDGGSGNDPHNNGQSLNTMLGKILRIDVDHATAGKGYGIPADNPFVARKDANPEIYAYGLRNPWRWSFDRKTGEFYAGDVGQNNWEEIDLIRKGGNYGWRVMEGFHCTPKINPDCDQTGLEKPLVEYDRQGGVSVTGGFVYRGQKYPALQGAYLYGDYGTRRVWALRQTDGRVTEQREVGMSPQPISSFAEGRDGELFVVGYGGAILRVEPAAP